MRWIHYVFGNSIAIASFAEPSAELRIESSLKLESYVVAQPASQVAQEAGNYPFIYSADDRIDLRRLRERQYTDPYNGSDRGLKAASAATRPHNIVICQMNSMSYVWGIVREEHQYQRYPTFRSIQ